MIEKLGGALVQHIRALWPGPGVWLPVPFVVWTLGCIVMGAGRAEHVLFLVGMPLLAYVATPTKRLFVGLLPMALLGLLYDAMRWLEHIGVSEGRVHLCDLRAIDMQIASVGVGGQRVSVQDWLQSHPSPALDLLFALPYGTFIFVAVAFAVFLYVKDYARMRLFGWGFLVVNLAGFTTYHLYPAAPPWYFHRYGCTIDLAAHAFEGANLARVDALLGIHYFRDFYARASDVFGAVPSLHCSYPTLILLFGWRVLRWPGRAGAIAFFVTMCSGAVYLDHHWIIDVVLGVAYTIASYALVMAVARRRAAREDEPRTVGENEPRTVPS